MSLRWPSKDPDENLPYSLDWSRFLEGQSIITVRWFIFDASGVKQEVINESTVNNVTVTGTFFTPTVATISLSGGRNRAEYTISCQITFGLDNLVAERTIKLVVRNR